MNKIIPKGEQENKVSIKDREGFHKIFWSITEKDGKTFLC